MTVHTKAATDEIYDLFNQPLKCMPEPTEETDSDEESEDDDEYMSGGESTGTGHLSGTNSDFGDETQGELTEAKSIVDVDNHTRNDTTQSEFTGTGNDDGTDHSEDWEHVENRVKSDDVDPVGEEQRQLTDEVTTPSSPVAQSSEPEPGHQPVTADTFEIPRRPYRNAIQTAQNRLPFMTPIVEKTESSLGTVTGHHDKDYFTSKTPCPKASRKTPTIPEMDDEVWSSPFQEELNEVLQGDLKMPQPLLVKSKPNASAPLMVRQDTKITNDKVNKGPLIVEAQCNPMEDGIHKTILEGIQPALITFEGYFEHKDATYNRKTEIRKFCKTVANAKASRNGTDKTASTIIIPPVLSFSGTDRQYAIKRELGAGAYAPVYLAEHIEATSDNDGNDETPAIMGKGKFGITRRALEAVKMEEPPSAWEFYIIRTAHRRLGVSRAAESIVQAYEMHLFRDEGYLIEEYRDQGTLLDLVNATVQQNNNGSAMDELLAMFFVVELLRTTEALHARGIIHGDLKADNILVRMPHVDADLGGQYRPNGTEGWSQKGVTLIDLGRGIDMRAFRPDVQFIADWETSATDCAEMRELRPWTFQADYHGIAAIAHTLLFGRYIETIAEKGAGAGIGGGRTYKLKEGLKRYWQSDIWSELFSLMLNPARHTDVEDGQKMPCIRGMGSVREKMEAWLVANGEKGVGLRALIRKSEMLVGSKKKS